MGKEAGNGRELVRAAGGVIVRRSRKGPKVLLVHRPRYDDWSLPKGKLEPRETYREAALREVEEETGLRCEILEELQPSRYVDNHGRPKKVRWFLMRPLRGKFEPNDEVDEAKWLRLEKAQRKVDYEHDKVLVRELRFRSHPDSDTGTLEIC